MINIGIGIGWAKAIYSVANNVIANFKARVLSYPGSIFEAGPCLHTTLEELNAIGLLDNASLVITPNAYNEGILYDVVPNTTLGDMNVVRATTATRVNEQGLIEVVPRNLLTYSESNLATYGTVIGNATDATTSINGFSNSIQVGNNSVTTFVYKRNFTPTIGVEYTLSLFLQMDDDSEPIIGTTNSTGDFSLVLSGVLGVLNLQKIRLGATNIYRVSASIVATSTNTQFGVVKYTTQSSKPFRFTGIQLEQGSTATEYFPTTTRLNIPRIDYTNGSCPSLLVEPQRTNLALYSEQFDNAYWVKSETTTTANFAISPDGSMTADKIAVNSVFTVHRITNTISITTATTYTLSIYAKKNNFDFIFFRENINGTFENTFFNVSNGTLGSIATNRTAKIENTGNGWYRCSITGTSTLTSYSFGIGVSNTNGVIAFLGNGTDYNLIWGAQLEAGSNATSYIPTVASSVTRNTDIVSNSNLISKGLIVNDYTLFLDITNPILGSQYILDSRDISSVRTGILRVNGTTASVTDIGGGSSLSILSILTIGKGKMCLKRTGNVISFFANGVKCVSTTTTTAGTINTLATGVINSTTGSYINSISLFPLALTDTECITLTTL